MERPRPSTIAWGALAAGVFAYDYLCPEGEQLSERCDEWVEKPVHRAALYGTIGAVGLHLVNKIDPRLDVLHHMSQLRRAVNK